MQIEGGLSVTAGLSRYAMALEKIIPSYETQHVSWDAFGKLSVFLDSL